MSIQARRDFAFESATLQISSTADTKKGPLEEVLAYASCSDNSLEEFLRFFEDL